MSLKTALEKLLKGEQAADNAQPQNLCPAGLHPRDSLWQEGMVCMYCEADRKRRAKTAMMPGAEGGEAPAPAAGAPGRAGRTRIIDPSPDQGPGDPSAHSRGDRRRIVAVLVSFTWQPEGQLFVLRTGKNPIGAGVAGEPDPEILITSDPTMSGEHAMILYQAGTCYVHDLMSANGTWLQGRRMTPGSTLELSNYATIKTGSTVWTFIQVHQGGASPGETVPADDVVQEPRPMADDDPEFKPETPRKPRNPGGTIIN